MDEYKGMNFQDWCKLDESDNRKINYKTPYGKFTSDEQINFNIVELIRECYIKKINLINDEWHIHLVKDKLYASK